MWYTKVVTPRARCNLFPLSNKFLQSCLHLMEETECEVICPRSCILKAREPGLLPPRAESLYCTFGSDPGRQERQRGVRWVKNCEARIIVPALQAPFSIHFAFGQFPPNLGGGGWVSGVEMASWTDINTPPTLPTGQGPVPTWTPSSGDGTIIRGWRQDSGRSSFKRIICTFHQFYS